MKNSAMESRHLSESNEWYTPKPIVDAGRSLMGGIDLDPASNEFANQVVGAKVILTASDNGFTRGWSYRSLPTKVLHNPPGGRCDDYGVTVHRVENEWSCVSDEKCPHDHRAQASARAWWYKLVGEYRAGNVEQAVFVAFSVELFQVSQSEKDVFFHLAKYPHVMPRSRVAYDRIVDGKRVIGSAPPHSSSIVWLPPKGVCTDLSLTKANLERHFAWLGDCVVPF